MKLTPIELVDAHDWLLDCCSTEEDVEAVNDMSDEEIEQHVEKHFIGGIKAWKACYLEEGAV